MEFRWQIFDWMFFFSVIFVWIRLSITWSGKVTARMTIHGSQKRIWTVPIWFPHSKKLVPKKKPKNVTVNNNHLNSSNRFLLAWKRRQRHSFETDFQWLLFQLMHSYRSYCRIIAAESTIILKIKTQSVLYIYRDTKIALIVSSPK